MEKYVTRFWQLRQLQNILLNLGILIFYVICGKLGLSFAHVNPSATVIWPPTGIAFAALFVFGYRVAPAIFLGAFLVNLTTAGTILTSLGIATGNTLEGIIGVLLVRKFIKNGGPLDSFTNIFVFTLFAGIVSTMASASIGFITLFLGHLATLKEFWSIWSTWWLGDMGGDLVFAPFLLTWILYPQGFNIKKIFYFLLSLLGLFIVTQIVFSGLLPYAYLCLPLAVWIALWFEQKGATVATLFVAVIAISYTVTGSGPFATSSINQSLLFLQLFLNIFSLTALVFSATIVSTRSSQKILTSQEQRFKSLIEKSFDAVVLIDISSKILYASPSVERLLGYTPEELINMTGFDLVIPSDRKMTMQTLAKLVLKPNSTVTITYQTMRKDKKIIWVEATGTNLLLDPNVNAVVVNFRDITERKIAQEKILQEMQEDEAMLSSIGDGIIATDYAGKINIVNQAACDAIGWSEKELLGKDIVTAIPMQDETGNTIQRQSRPITKVITLGKTIVTSPTNYYVRKDKTRFPVRFILTPIILNKKIIGTIEVFHDITKEKEIDKAKTEFVSLASHQLRTPLATINWYIESLMKDNKKFNQTESEYLQEVYRASKRMINLIDSLLNTSRLDLGTFMVEPKRIQVSAVATDVIKEIMGEKRMQKGVIVTHFQTHLPDIEADPKLLTIILQNLLSNAIKYNKEDKKIDFAITADKKNLTIKVADQGYGIPKKQQDKVFAKMFRADNARSIDPEGSGLGLYIVKSIIDATGGKIWFESEENIGTTFFVSFSRKGMRKKEGQKLLR